MGPEKILGRRVVGPVREGGEADHFITCRCGHRVDMRRLDQVLEHERTCPYGGALPLAPPPAV